MGSLSEFGFIVEEETTVNEREFAARTPDVVGAAIGLMVSRPEFGQRAMVKDARECSEDPAVGNDENGFGLARKRDEDLVEKTAKPSFDFRERLAAIAGHVPRRVFERRSDVVVREGADGRSLVRPEVDFVKSIINDGCDAVRCCEYLGGVPCAAVGTRKRVVESESCGHEPIARQLGLADATRVDVDFDDAALDAHFAVPVRLAVPDEKDVHRRVLYHSPSRSAGMERRILV